MNQPKVVYQFLGEEMRRLSYESVRVIVVNTKYRFIGMEEISRGSVNEALVHPREVLRPVIQRQAFGFVLVHNHPSGDPEPSLPDRQLTTSLKAASELMQLRFVDHMIIGSPREGQSSYYSFQENGLLTRL
jgi:DNA repair protein RadC